MAGKKGICLFFYVFKGGSELIKGTNRVRGKKQILVCLLKVGVGKLWGRMLAEWLERGPERMTFTQNLTQNLGLGYYKAMDKLRMLSHVI